MDSFSCSSNAAKAPSFCCRRYCHDSIHCLRCSGHSPSSCAAKMIRSARVAARAAAVVRGALPRGVEFAPGEVETHFWRELIDQPDTGTLGALPPGNVLVQHHYLGTLLDMFRIGLRRGQSFGVHSDGNLCSLAQPWVGMSSGQKIILVPASTYSQHSNRFFFGYGDDIGDVNSDLDGKKGEYGLTL